MEVVDPLVAGQVRIADEPQMGLETQLGEARCQSADARGKAAGAAVGIRSLERNEMKL
jgi:hypothetical protein